MNCERFGNMGVLSISCVLPTLLQNSSGFMVALTLTIVPRELLRSLHSVYIALMSVAMWLWICNKLISDGISLANTTFGFKAFKDSRCSDSKENLLYI